MTSMSTSLSVVQGVTTPFDIELVDGEGESYPLASLADATAILVIREDEEDVTDVLSYSTDTDTTKLWFDTVDSVLHLKFIPADTTAMTVGTYVYRVRLTLADGTIYDAIPWSPFDLNLGGASAVPQPTFSNTVSLDHNYGLTDELQFVKPGGDPIPGAQIRVFYRSEYNAGVFTNPVGITETNASGRWVNPIMVTPGFEYVVQFFKPNEFGPNIAIITV